MNWRADSAAWFADSAVLPTGIAHNVLITATAGRFTSVIADSEPGDAAPLRGLVVPGFANAHSHAFHRALRGRTQAGRGSFWSWRDAMYGLAARLDPDSYLRLATAVYAEMATVGITSVGEFHYLHHGDGGHQYDDPNAMAQALREAARLAGVRLTLIDACYLTGGLDAGGYQPTSAVQQRFADANVDAWAARVDALSADSGFRIGAAAHSVGAVRAVAWAAVRATAAGRPLHIHLSEQPAENAAVLGFHGCTPTQLLDRVGFWSDNTTAVHATHVTAGDITSLAIARATVCLCPTTERDLADGIGPARHLADAGVGLSLGSDQNAVIDLFEEARGMEMHERLTSNERGRFAVNDVMAAMLGHSSIGWDDAGRIEAGARADLVAIRLDTPRTAGIDPAQVIFAATGSDIDSVIIDGRVIVNGGRHLLGDVGALLSAAIDPLWSD
jgi:formiminoglutamate deiminase